MHHTLRVYGKHQHRLIHLYMRLAKITRIPVIGDMARWIANLWGIHGHGGYLLTLSEAEQIVDIAKSVAVGPCSCRQEFHNCDNSIMTEIVLANGGSEVYADRQEDFKQVSKEEAKKILRQAHEKKLLQSIMRCGDQFYSICSCCSCCCVPLRLRQQYGVGQALIRNVNVVQDFQAQQLH